MSPPTGIRQGGSEPKVDKSPIILKDSESCSAKDVNDCEPKFNAQIQSYKDQTHRGLIDCFIDTEVTQAGGETTFHQVQTCNYQTSVDYGKKNPTVVAPELPEVQGQLEQTDVQGQLEQTEVKDMSVAEVRGDGIIEEL